MMTKDNQRKFLKILLVIPISPNRIFVITPDRNNNYTRRCLHANAVIKKTPKRAACHERALVIMFGAINYTLVRKEKRTIEEDKKMEQDGI